MWEIFIKMDIFIFKELVKGSFVCVLCYVGLRLNGYGRVDYLMSLVFDVLLYQIGIFMKVKLFM